MVEDPASDPEILPASLAQALAAGSSVGLWGGKHNHNCPVSRALTTTDPVSCTVEHGLLHSWASQILSLPCFETLPPAQLPQKLFPLWLADASLECSSDTRSCWWTCHHYQYIAMCKSSGPA